MNKDTKISNYIEFVLTFNLYFYKKTELFSLEIAENLQIYGHFSPFFIQIGSMIISSFFLI